MHEPACFSSPFKRIVTRMGLPYKLVAPTEPVTLTVEQVTQLERELTEMRHDINGDITVLFSAVQLMRYNPSRAQETLANIDLSALQEKFRKRVDGFTAEFNRLLQVRREALNPPVRTYPPLTESLRAAMSRNGRATPQTPIVPPPDLPPSDSPSP